MSKMPQGRVTSGYQQFPKPPTPAGRGTTRRTCTFCGKNGHTIEVCYKKHGYPPGHKFHNPSQPVANAVHTNHEDLADVPDDSTPSFNFTAEQYQNLLALIQPPANNVAPVKVNFASINQNTATKLSKVSQMLVTGSLIQEPLTTSVTPYITLHHIERLILSL